MDEIDHLDPDRDAVDPELLELDGKTATIIDMKTGERLEGVVSVPIDLIAWSKRKRERFYEELGIEPDGRSARPRPG